MDPSWVWQCARPYCHESKSLPQRLLSVCFFYPEQFMCLKHHVCHWVNSGYLGKVRIKYCIYNFVYIYIYTHLNSTKYIFGCFKMFRVTVFFSNHLGWQCRNRANRFEGVKPRVIARHSNDLSHDGSMVLLYIYMATWIPSIYPFMLAYIPAPWILWV